MRWLITGVPGTGKTQAANIVSKKLHWKVWNDRLFCKRHGLGKMVGGALEVSLRELRSIALKELKKTGNVLLEGHLWCEVSLPLDGVIVLHAKPQGLEQRLRERGYSWEKTLDNVFLEGADYCGKQARQHYRKTPIVHVAQGLTLKEVVAEILAIIQKKKKAKKK